MHLHARLHVGADDATSWFTDGAWRCDLGHMGEQSCWTPAHRPYRAQALALDCAVTCPARLPSDYGL